MNEAAAVAEYGADMVSSLFSRQHTDSNVSNKIQILRVRFNAVCECWFLLTGGSEDEPAGVSRRVFISDRNPDRNRYRRKWGKSDYDSDYDRIGFFSA